MSSIGQHRRSPWQLLVTLVTLTLLGSLLTVGTSGTASAAPDPGGKVKPKLAKQLDRKDEAPFWIRFEQADLTSFAQNRSWDRRGQAVYDTLTASADTEQKEAKAILDAAKVSYQSFWATNAIRVEAGDGELVADIAALPEVKALYPTFEYRLEEPKEGKPLHQVDSVEWGIANINADDVWNDYGVRGEGLVIASIDSGVQYDHPAVVDQYRGNNGDGTFTHDYNWFDASGQCDDGPCDNDGHGTHTMGTMVGDDGGSNQIGVAPGATWIAANGCCTSDATLIASGEWMLAPTDLGGENPDVSKRPNIVNNSWGTELPSNDPFMEDIEEAWASSGIFATWSNGNNGPACETSGSPGSRTINYSVGAYDSSNDIAGFSSRGVGQSGEIKPNISAPGVNVRSSIPGSDYTTFSGTSMAAPHLAGTIALLWEAAPSLYGDVDATRDLLDGTAIDTADDQCGGTADDNNVFGEGRLDAMALIGQAPVGETGTLAGTVTDADGGDPLAEATVEVSGEVDRTVTTGADGTYEVLLPTGDYDVSVAKFGYGTVTDSATVEADTTTTYDVALTAAESTTLTGTVTDGSGHGWPLYAHVEVDGPASDTWTDPETGDYSVTVPSDATYGVTISAEYPGYVASTEDVTIGSGATTHDAALEVDATTCVAPGYTHHVDGTTEDFESGAVPDDWSVVDDAGTGQVWTFDDPGERGNLTGGAGGFAIMDSDEYGSGGEQDTSLISPSVDMSDLTSPVIGFAQDYRNLGDVADVDVSIDGGQTWETVLNQTTSVRGPRTDVVELPTAAGQSDVQVRFHQYDADYDWWWEVDDVFIGNRTCDPVPGGLVLGTVSDGGSGDGIVGAKVTSLDRPADSATTTATPEDDDLGDGFYWMFSHLSGEHPFEATANQYGAQTSPVDVAEDDATRADFSLGAGHLTVSPDSVEGLFTLGARPSSKTVKIENDGTAAVDVELTEQAGGFEILRADGSKHSRASIAKADGAPLQELKVPVSLKAMAGNRMTMHREPAGGRAPQEAPWTDIADYPETIMDNRVVSVDGVAYTLGGGDGTTSTAAVNAYDPATLSWTAKAPLPEARNALAAGAVGGKIVVTGGWAEDGPSPITWTYDPDADNWSEGADSPVSVSAAGQAVADGKLYVVGGCTTSDCTPMSSSVAAYDAGSDSWEELADYPEAVAFASCGAVEGSLYCTGGNDGGGGTAASYVYDAGADAWSTLPDAPVATWASNYTTANGMLVVNGGVQGSVVANRTFAYDPAAGDWTDLPNSNTARYRGGAACGMYKIGGSSGGFTATVDSEMLPGFEDCGAAASDVGWLSVSPQSATIEPGDTLTVKVTMDPSVAQPGTYTAQVGIRENAPGSVGPIDVTMRVAPPKRWGKLMGTTSAAACDGDITPLPGTTVQVDADAASWTFDTDADGRYAYWIDTKVAKRLQLIAAKDGYQPKTTTVKLTRGQTTTADFTLKERGCS